VNFSAYQNIVVYALPGETTFYKLHQKNGGLSSKDESGNLCFMVQPFDEEKAPIYIKAEIHEPIDVNALFTDLPEAPPLSIQLKTDYQNQVSAAVSALGNSNGKVVMSRIAVTQFKSIDIGSSLAQLRAKFPQAFIYFLKLETEGVWLGATPESLLEQWGEDFHTMALAGTRAFEELFTQKEFDEQYLVTKDLLERLQNVPVEVGDVHEFAFGRIKHLRTLLQWKSSNSASYFAKHLHPTPAVAGYPRSLALQIIKDLEQHNRQLYTGYLGLLNRGSASARLFVNLRCMRLFNKEWWYFTGGGINSQSVPEFEWQETVQKEQSVSDAMVFLR
jgi:isochorismate synthase